MDEDDLMDQMMEERYIWEDETEMQQELMEEAMYDRQ